MLKAPIMLASVTKTQGVYIIHIPLVYIYCTITKYDAKIGAYGKGMVAFEL